MRSVLFYLSILAAALAGGVYFAGALIDPAVYALAALPSSPNADVSARFAKSPAPEPTPAPAAAAERTVVIAPPAALERSVETERTRALRKAHEARSEVRTEARKQTAKRKPRRSNADVASGPSQDSMSFAPRPTFGPFTSDSW